MRIIEEEYTLMLEFMHMEDLVKKSQKIVNNERIINILNYVMEHKFSHYQTNVFYVIKIAQQNSNIKTIGCHNV